MQKADVKTEIITEQANQNPSETAIPLSLTIISILCGSLMVVVAIVMIFVPYTRVERVQGRVEAEQGVIKIYAQAASNVVIRHVSEGEVVHKGQPLLTLSDERKLNSGDGMQLALGKQSSLKAETIRQEMQNIQSLYTSEQTLLDVQIRRKQSEVDQTKANVDIQERSFQLAKEVFKRRSELVNRGFVSKESLSDEEQKLLLAEASYEAAKKDLISFQAAVEELQANKSTLARRREKELFPLTRTLSATSQESIDFEAKKEFVISATAEGIVSMLLPKPGDTVLENEYLLSILPNNSRFLVNLYIPSSAIGFIKPQTAVRLRYEAYPYQKFGEYRGVVKTISSTALDSRELKLPSLSADSYYRVQVEPDEQTVHAYGRRFSLHDGMKVEADVEVETRKILEWVLEPIYAKYYGK